MSSYSIPYPLSKNVLTADKKTRVACQPAMNITDLTLFSTANFGARGMFLLVNINEHELGYVTREKRPKTKSIKRQCISEKVALTDGKARAYLLQTHLLLLSTLDIVCIKIYIILAFCDSKFELCGKRQHFHYLWRENEKYQAVCISSPI